MQLLTWAKFECQKLGILNFTKRLVEMLKVEQKKKKNPEVGMVHRESAYNKYIPTYKYEYVSRYFMFDQIGLKNTIPQQTRPLKS